MRVRSRGQHRALAPAVQCHHDIRLVAEVERLRNANRRLAAERNELEAQLDTAAIDYSGVLEDLRVAREENQRLRAAAAQTVSVVPLHQSPLADDAA